MTPQKQTLIWERFIITRKYRATYTQPYASPGGWTQLTPAEMRALDG
jgi:hypothetical protein